MKARHNKKRNTAFVFESLIRELTSLVLKEDEEQKQKVINIIKKHFKEGSALKKDLECYRSLYEDQNLDRFTSEKILKEVKVQKRLIDPEGLFIQQTELIHDINKETSSEIFNNFVPNYRTLASIAQIFSGKTSPKNQVVLENEIIKNMLKEEQSKLDMDSVDKLVYKTFVEKFNNKYDTDLLEEQKELLTRYIVSFSDNALDLKLYLNEEIARLKKTLKKAKEVKEIKADSDMLKKTVEIVQRLESYSKEPINENILLTVLKTQALVKEIYRDANND